MGNFSLAQLVCNGLINSKNSKIRVAHLVSHPIQYFAPLYRAISQKSEIDLTVYFLSDASLREHPDLGFGRAVQWDIPLLGGYNHILCGDAQSRPIPSGFALRPNWAIMRSLLREKYDVIWIHGYNSENTWMATAIGRLFGAKVLLREEQTLLTPRSTFRRLAKQVVLPFLFRNVTGLCIGTNSQKFFEGYGTKTTFRVSYCVDNNFFRQWRDRLAPSRIEIRRRLGIATDHPVILFSGKFIDKKQPLLLLEAFRRLRRELKCYLLLTGDGPLRPELQQTIAREGIPDVILTGFLNQTELPSAYTAADLLVLPSAYHETWGLVVNEAMNFGLPIIVSDRVGCAEDLVRDGDNGFVFKSGDTEGLTHAIRQLVSSAMLRKQFGLRSSEIIGDFSIEVVCDQFVQACLAVMKSRPSKHQPMLDDLRA